MAYLGPVETPLWYVWHLTLWHAHRLRIPAGDVMYLRVFSTPMIVLSSYKAATELLDGCGMSACLCMIYFMLMTGISGRVYSGRPPAIMAGELYVDGSD